MKKWLSFLIVLTCVVFPAKAFESRDEMRAAHQALGMFSQDTPYAQLPKVSAPYETGRVQELALNEALGYLNFLRTMAGVEPVERSELYDFRCQHGAVLLAALDYLDHNAPQPADMDKDFYDSAHTATEASNIAMLNWMRPTILREGIAYFARDDRDYNLPVLGHRRWLLSPYMSATGFGLANSERGMSYVVMYAHDMGRQDAQWSEIAWPTAGVFPVELMHTDLAWSVSLNPEIYDVAASRIRAELAEEQLGLYFQFDCTEGTGDGFCTVSTENYGGGPCVIFRPDFEGIDFTDYEQNQKWKVKLTGLVKTDGTDAEFEFEVEMASLYVQEVVNVEVSQLEAELKTGKTLRLSAAVIPDYADDLSISWTSSDPFIASVESDGTVSANAVGSCEITVQSANGRFDVCKVTVTE